MTNKNDEGTKKRFSLFPNIQKRTSSEKIITRQQLPEPVKAWSWAGFGLAWIYFAGMSAPEATVYTFMAVVMANFATKYSDPLLVFTGGVLALAIPVYSAIKGREVAWGSRKWDSIMEFEANQKIWDRWGIGLFAMFSVAKTILLLLEQR